MNTQQQQKERQEVAEKSAREEKSKQEVKEGQSTKQQSPTNTTTSPPSASSSPSHEFSFTISLHPPSKVPDKTKSPPSFAIDLSPADEIFFHGHLLPLHLLSHLPISPRSSTNSLNNFSLPTKDVLDDQKPNSNSNSSSSNNNSNHGNNTSETKARIKSKSFSLFGLTRWRKGGEIREKEDEEEEKNKRRKLRIDVTHILKRYARMARPLWFFSRGKKGNHQFRRQPYSFSGNLSLSGKQEWRGRRGGEFSAPASMRTSPTNSGLLVATATLPSSTSDSTMEELQTAIQAAIAHCKNSIAVKEEKLKS
ncbi:hypothetical protein HHK36_030913 [Tetracentron sinense]|uniref:BRI1 kinase inhibitor 1 n=1 Tax=Tetracentron sinense TaxID=13715 RepID=A0A835D155_TETSI|nr:hypothetical protein HHK36_030913 [Tetracentron sinense]